MLRPLHTPDPGLWREVRVPPPRAGRACLFLDRDGVIVEETHYLSRPDDMRLIPGAAAAIRDAHARGLAVVIVTNQAGIGRGLFDWPAFAAVQAAIHAALAGDGAHVDAVYACAYHEQGQGSLRHTGDHPWRKPEPGMLLAAAGDLDLDLAHSWIVGDRASDLAAGRAAGLRGGTLVATGYGQDGKQAPAALTLASNAFSVKFAASLAGIGSP